MELFAIVILIIAIGFVIWKLGEVAIHAIGSFGNLCIRFFNGEMSGAGAIIFGGILLAIFITLLVQVVKILSYYKTGIRKW